MPLLVSLPELEGEDLEIRGELTAAELELEQVDPMLRLREPVRYALTVQLLGTGLLLTGSLALELDCECVRCLKPFTDTLRLTDTLIDLPLEGEEAVPVVAEAVDLTPSLREHILLALPPHPVCRPDCGGLSLGARARKPAPGRQPPAGGNPSPWDQLDQLKL
jgi:uncharacterized metal-binding protein YceD (DUF177 family)